LWFWLLRVRVPLATPLLLSVKVRENSRLRIAGMVAAKSACMTSSPDFTETKTSKNVLPFWEHILNQQELRESAPLKKLLVACELIAALDGDVELLAAA
jgi:hypothetical protein